MIRAKDMAGQQFGRLTVIQRAGVQGSRNATWLCSCECGEVAEIRGDLLRSGMSKSCGCGRSGRPQDHGHASNGDRSPTYVSWHAMIGRCSYASVSSYDHYGGRGILVCDRWKSFENFLADMGERPSRDHCLSRIDHDGNYEPGNVTWELKADNAREVLARTKAMRRKAA